MIWFIFTLLLPYAYSFYHHVLIWCYHTVEGHIVEDNVQLVRYIGFAIEGFPTGTIDSDIKTHL
ncbi:hypothetical protein ACJX0J_016822, partial [Zea mays]